ncbi:xeroderma pigmentosum group C-complementing protein [Entomortierella parvispora]|uniref:Xeroderma pigmentosum group C-complementing protein n=1 Tax=Entomortierella parvispora TaxID=205924 RepID=A0A9P3H5U3_9FUNG|nr:xeroderma pigmentosum group C-complementing protein [Entomortierella parvispora]
MPPKRTAANRAAEAAIPRPHPHAATTTTTTTAPSTSSSTSTNRGRASLRRPASARFVAEGPSDLTQSATKSDTVMSTDPHPVSRMEMRASVTDSLAQEGARVPKRPADGDRIPGKQKVKRPIRDDELDVFEEEGSINMTVDEAASTSCDAEEGSEDDEIDWEEVPVPAVEADQQDEQEDYCYGNEELSGPWQYSAVEIVFDRPPEPSKKVPSRGITKEDRIIRVLVHQTHLLCLIANGLRRNHWINHPNLSSVALSLVPPHIAEPLQMTPTDPTREVNALQVLARWWMDSFVVTGPCIQLQEYVDVEAAGFEGAFPDSPVESIKKRKNLQRRLLNRSGSSDVCAQLFTAICRSLGLKARIIESLQACPFKVTLPKEESSALTEAAAEEGVSSVKKGKGRKKEVELDESDTTRGSRVVIPTPHRIGKKPVKFPPNHKQSDPPVFWTEVYSTLSKKWITIDPVRGFVNTPLKMHPSTSCTTNNLAYVVAYDEDGYVTDVTRRYTSQWGSATKKLRVQPSGPERFDWWAQTVQGLSNPHPTREEDIEEAQLLQAEISERMPTKLGDFNNHPLYALERHLKKFEVLHPKIPVLGHIRGEAIFPRSCVKQVRSKENWLKRARQLKGDDLIPVRWVKSRPATIYRMRLQQQAALSGKVGGDKKNISQNLDNDDDMQDSLSEVGSEDGNDADQIPLFGEWQTEAYQPPWVVDGKVPRNQFGRQDVFTPAMVPIGGTHLKGRNVARIARQLGVDYVEAVTGFEFQSRRSVPIIQGIIVPTECAEIVMDAYHEVSHHADQEANKRKNAEILRRWRKLIKGAMVRARLLEEYGDGMEGEDDDRDSWLPEDDDDDDDDKSRLNEGMTQISAGGNDTKDEEGGGFML